MAGLIERLDCRLGQVGPQRRLVGPVGPHLDQPQPGVSWRPEFLGQLAGGADAAVRNPRGSGERR